MTGIPEFCTVCGRQNDATPAFRIQPGVSVEQLHLQDNQGRCPYCGGITRVIDGTFNIRDGLIEVLSASRWTRDKLQELQRAVQHTLVAWPTLDADQAVDQVATVDPTVAALLRGPWSRADVLALLSLIAAVIFGILSALPHDAPTTVRIDPQQLRQVIDQQQVDAPSPPSGQPAPGKLSPAQRTPQSPSPGKQPPAGP